jgi:hypothetical protein
MNSKIKQVVEKASKTSKSLLQRSSSSSSRREALIRHLDPEVADRLIALQRSNEEEE